MRQHAKRLYLVRLDGQPTRLIVLCEAAGMAPQLAAIANQYGV
jgi:hypothetical protein